MNDFRNTPIALLMKHGDNDFTLWQPEIPADDPLWLALLEKYENTGYSERGVREELGVSIGTCFPEVQPYVYVVVYHDSSYGYVGMDVFRSLDAAKEQFNHRMADTQSEHPDDPEWVKLYEQGEDDQDLYFIAKNGYETFIRRERIQETAENKLKCGFCGHSFSPQKFGQLIHRCQKCQRYFCRHCYTTLTGDQAAAQSHPSCCPSCFLREAVRGKLTQWLGDYAARMPETFLMTVVSDMAASSGFYEEGGFNDDDIRLAFGRVVARQFGVEV